MSAPGFWEIAFLAILALLIFGPERLPGMARSVGKTVANLKREANSTLQELKVAAELDEIRGVADDLRSTGKELSAAAALAGPVASEARPTGGGQATVRAVGDLPPFDPDAT